jgi:transposase
MPRKSPFKVNLSSEERQALESMARKYTSPYCDVIRAKIVLLADEGFSNDVIASRLDAPHQIVSKWRKRFAFARLPGLEAQPRGGRKARFSPPGLVVQVKALACELPHTLGLPLSRETRILDNMPTPTVLKPVKPRKPLQPVPSLRR